MAEQAAEAEELEIIETPDGLPPPGDDTVEAAAQQDDDDGEDEGDERLGSNENDDDGAEPTQADRRRRQRERRRQSRENKDRLLDNLRAENQALATRLAAVETSQIATSHLTLDQRLSAARANAAQAAEIMRRAEEAGNFGDYRTAEKFHDEALAEAKALEPEVQRLSQVRQQPQQQTQGPPPEAIALQNAWKEANAWYSDDPNHADPQVRSNSNMARLISGQLLNEGLMPTTVAHWREVTRRMNEMAAGNRADDDEPQRQQARKGPPVNAQRTGAGNGTPGKNQVYLSADRVEAMKMAGIWDDIPRRNAQIKAFQQWDRENSAHVKGGS